MDSRLIYVQTEYSFLTSTITINKLINKAKEDNIKVLGIADINMFGVMEFYTECIKNNIKPVIGLEVNINDINIVIYAKNYEGYKNLCRISTIVSENNFNIDVLKKYSSNLICFISISNMELYKKLKQIFSDIYLTYSVLAEKNDKYDNLVFLPKTRSFKDDSDSLVYLESIKKGRLINDYKIADIYQEKDYNNKLLNRILNDVNIEIMKDETLMPIYEVSNQKLFLKELCKKGLSKRLNNDIPNNYKERLEYELNVINDMGYNNYFLIVWDYVKYARKSNILMGARGSAVSSLVSYSLGISDTDPLKYNLIFERFLNKERITMPDIDIDFDNTKREDIINYLINKYGKKSCLKIVTFSHLSSKQVIRDIAKVLDYESYKIDMLTKALDEKKDLIQNKDSNDIKNLLEDSKINEIYNISIKLEGLKRHYSIHAAGVVISNKELDNYIPLSLYSDGSYITSFSMNYLEDLGLLKMDILGLKTLSIIDEVLNKININYNDIPLDDKNTFNIFQEGLLEGIFQFETPGMKKTILELKPTNIDDLIALVALFRPGPMDNIPSYIKRKEYKEKTDYINKDLEEILSSTYGIIIYQEQIMQIASKMASYSMGEADILRRAMSKKKLDILESEESKFISNSIKNGYSNKEAKEVYDLILKFANYGFPKSHSVEYAILGYKMAYLKANYKLEFMSTLLTYSIGNVSKTKTIINECKKLNISIEMPDINLSSLKYEILDNKIYYSISMIKGIGINLCKEIINERIKPFEDFFDFVSRMNEKISKEQITNLIYAECFRSFNYNKKTLIESIDTAYNYAYLVKDTDSKLVNKPEIIKETEFTKEELINIEKDLFGYYLSNHPVTKYNLDRKVNTNNIDKYFDNNVEIILNLEYKKTIDTKTNEKMMFIDASDEYGNCELVIFPKKYNTYFDIRVPNVYKVIGKVEKRLSKYQIIVYEIIHL